MLDVFTFPMYVYPIGKVTHKQKIICMTHLPVSIHVIPVYVKDACIPTFYTNVYVLLHINMCELRCSIRLSSNILLRVR